MDSEKLRKMLAGISIAALVTGVALNIGCNKSDVDEKKDSGSVEKSEEAPAPAAEQPKGKSG